MTAQRAHWTSQLARRSLHWQPAEECIPAYRTPFTPGCGLSGDPCAVQLQWSDELEKACSSRAHPAQGRACWRLSLAQRLPPPGLQWPFCTTPAWVYGFTMTEGFGTRLGMAGWAGSLLKQLLTLVLDSVPQLRAAESCTGPYQGLMRRYILYALCLHLACIHLACSCVKACLLLNALESRQAAQCSMA